MYYSKKHFTGTGLLNSILALIITAIILTSTSCNSDIGAKIASTDSLGAIRFAPVKYPVQDINVLLNAPYLDHFVLQYVSPAGNYTDPFTLVSYARDTAGGFIDTTGYDLSPSDTLNFKNFKGPFALGNLKVPRTQIDSLLTTKNGQKLKDGFLLFTPEFDNDYQYLYYSIEVKGSSISKDSTLIPSAKARPCPPAPNCIEKPGEQ